MTGRTRAALLGAGLLALSSCTSGAPSAAPPPSSAPSSSAAAGVPTPEHVMVVVFENEDYGKIIGSAKAPFLTSLAAQGVTFTDAHAVTHPSQPNYLALFSGSTQGVDDDSCPQTFSGDNLAGQLLAAGRTFVGYSEDLPGAGFTGCSAGKYARKHNPWVDFPALPAAVNQPLTALPADYAGLPTVSVVVPNLCNDMHDCGVAAGDAWAREHLAPYAEWARRHDSLLIVTFDEDSGTEDNHIPTFLVGAMVAPGTSSRRIDHYNVLRTIEQMYGLSPLGEAAVRKPITGVWTSSGG